MKKLMVAIAAAAVSLAGLADSVPTWFDGGFVVGQDAWGGAWVTNTVGYTDPDMEVQDSAYNLLMDDVDLAAPVAFRATEAKSSASGTVAVDTSVKFEGFDELPEIDSEAKSGICALVDGNFYVIDYDPVGLANGWKDTEIAADFEHSVKVQMVIDGTTVTYKIQREGVDEVPQEVVATTKGSAFQEVCYAGNGTASSLTGDYTLGKVAIVLPTIEGLTNTCAVASAYPGTEVTVNFFDYTKIASRASAVYVVQNDGTLVLKDGETAPAAIDPKAKIGTTLYLTFNAAYNAAGAADTIVICADQNLDVPESAGACTMTKAVKIDIAGCNFTVTNRYFVIGNTTVTVTNSVPESGQLMAQGCIDFAAGIILKGSSAVLDLQGLNICNFDRGYVMIDTPAGGTIKIPDTVPVSANNFFATGYFYSEAHAVPACTFIGGGKTYTGTPAKGYFVIAGEVATAQIAPHPSYAYQMPYTESFDSVQDAIDATNAVNLTANSSEDLVFGVNTVVTKNGFSLTGNLGAPSGYFVKDNGTAYVVSALPTITLTVDMGTYPDVIVYGNGLESGVVSGNIKTYQLAAGTPGFNISPVNPVAPYKKGYVATDWILKPGPGLTQIANNAFKIDDVTLGTASIALEGAYFAEMDYHLDLAGATNATDAVGRFYITNEVFQLKAPGCAGYTFVNWTNAAGIVVTEINPDLVTDVSVYASWASAGDPIQDAIDDGKAGTAIPLGGAPYVLDSDGKGFTFNEKKYVAKDHYVFRTIMGGLELAIDPAEAEITSIAESATDDGKMDIGTINTVAGFWYAVKRADNLEFTDAVTVEAIAGDGTAKQLSAPKDGAKQFYKIVVTDVAPVVD